ncbi:MAG: hypothetical protein AB8C84_12665 [Oligoflexales bacterium]
MKYVMLLISLIPSVLFSAGDDFEWVNSSALELPEEKYDAVAADDYILLQLKAPKASFPILKLVDEHEEDFEKKIDFVAVWKPFYVFAKAQLTQKMHSLSVNFHRAMEEFLEE